KEHIDGRIDEHGSAPDNHPERERMMAYVTGACSSDERSAVEDHCVACPLCRTQLSIILHMFVSPSSDQDWRELEALGPSGPRAAARAREIIKRQEQLEIRSAFWTRLGKKLQFLRPVLAPALVILTLLCGSLVVYLSLWRQSSEEKALSRVREIYHDA